MTLNFVSVKIIIPKHCLIHIYHLHNSSDSKLSNMVVAAQLIPAFCKQLQVAR